jgi:hypothetical protein
VSATLETVEKVEICEVAETVEDADLCEVATVSLPWGVEAVVLVVLVCAAGCCAEATTRAITETTRTIVTTSARVLRGGPSLFIGAPGQVVTIEGDGT